MGLMDFGAEASSAAHHLLEQDAGFHAAHEYQCCDLRNVNTRSQQVNSNNNAWEAFVLKTFNGIQHLFLITTAYGASDLHDAIIIHTFFRINVL